MTAEISLTNRQALAHAGTAQLTEKIRKARENFHSFVEFAMRDQNGRRIRQAVLHRVWIVHVMACWAAGRHPAILAPWGHGKTLELAIGLPAWLVSQNPGLRTKIVCNNDKRAMERVMGVSSLIRSPHYKLVFPHVREVPPEKARRTGQPQKWTQHEIYLDRPGFSIDPSFQAAGVLSGGIGGRADLLILDDVVDQKNALDEPSMRDKVINNVDNVWMSRLEPDGRVLSVNTPWHQSDFTHVILNRPAWSTLRIWVSEDFKRLEMEVHNPPPGYPLPVLEAALGRANGAAVSI